MKSQTRNQIVESFFQKNFLKSSKHVWKKKIILKIHIDLTRETKTTWKI